MSSGGKWQHGRNAPAPSSSPSSVAGQSAEPPLAALQQSVHIWTDDAARPSAVDAPVFALPADFDPLAEELVMMARTVWALQEPLAEAVATASDDEAPAVAASLAECVAHFEPELHAVPSSVARVTRQCAAFRFAATHRARQRRPSACVRPRRSAPATAQARAAADR